MLLLIQCSGPLYFWRASYTQCRAEFIIDYVTFLADLQAIKSVVMSSFRAGKIVKKVNRGKRSICPVINYDLGR